MVKYPVYVISHKRPNPEQSTTTKYLMKNNIPYIIVVSHNQVDTYKKFHKKVKGAPDGEGNAINSILNSHKNDDLIWITDDDWGDIKRPYTYKTAFEEAEKYVNPNVALIGFRHRNFFLKLPKITHNSSLFSLQLVRVSPIRYNPNNKYNLEHEFNIDNIIKGKKINLRLNDIWVLTEKGKGTQQHLDGGGNTSTYLAGHKKEDLSKEQMEKIKRQTLLMLSKETMNSMKKKYNFDNSFFITVKGGKKHIDFEKAVPKLKNWKEMIK